MPGRPGPHTCLQLKIVCTKACGNRPGQHQDCTTARAAGDIQMMHVLHTACMYCTTAVGSTCISSVVAADDQRADLCITQLVP